MHEDQSLRDRFDRARERKEPILFIVDEACRIVYESDANGFEQLVSFCPEPGRLRPDLCEVAGKLIKSRSASDLTARSAFVAPGHLMRLHRLHGTGGENLFALILEPFRSRDTVLVAARRYSLTKRELEILMLILEGANALDIKAALHISEHTVQGYFKRLLKKTASRNRAAMVANVLEWTPGASNKRVEDVREPDQPAGGRKAPL